MRFLEEPDIQDWLQRRRIRIDPPFSVEDRTEVRHRARPVTLRAAAQRCVASLAPWRECLLLVTEWDIWPGGVDWPAYYAARGAQGEKRSIDVAPGHLFRAREADLLAGFLALVFAHGWDALVLPAGRDRPAGPVVCVSHDGWLEYRSNA
jgi:hypothetical protein